MEAEVLRFVRAQDLLPPGSRVTCAVSGGADSMALLRCLLALREPLGLTVEAAHFNHLLRGEASDGDEAFVRDRCRAWGVPLRVGRGDAAAAAKAKGCSLETAARELRYAFLLEASDLIATAHQADDNAETVLAGPRGHPAPAGPHRPAPALRHPGGRAALSSGDGHALAGGCLQRGG